MRHEKIFMKIITAMLFIVLFPVFSPGAERALKTLSLDDAVTIALRNNHDYRIALHKQSEANEKVNEAWGQLFPILESEASLIRQGADSGFMSLSDGQYDIKFVQLRFGINPGIFYNSLQASKNGHKAALEEVRRIKADVEREVIQRYFSMILAEEMVRVVEDSISLLKENLKDVENLYKTGSVPKFELLQAKVRLKSQEPVLLDAENKFNLAADLFNYTLGFDKTGFAADRRILDENRYEQPSAERDKNIDRLSGLALRNRPEIIQLKINREIKENLKNISSSYYLWPTFSVGGYYGMTKLLPNQPDFSINAGPGTIRPDMSGITGNDKWQNTWQVRVAATYRWGSLVPLDAERAKERQFDQETIQAGEELTKLKNRIVISVRSSYSSLITSYYSIRSTKENIESAEEGLRIAKESYRAGVIKNSELLSAQLALSDARKSHINSVNGYFIALSELRKETGVDDERILFGGPQ